MAIERSERGHGWSCGHGGIIDWTSVVPFSFDGVESERVGRERIGGIVHGCIA